MLPKSPDDYRHTAIAADVYKRIRNHPLFNNFFLTGLGYWQGPTFSPALATGVQNENRK